MKFLSKLVTFEIKRTQRHCEERSDVAISCFVRSPRSLALVAEITPVHCTKKQKTVSPERSEGSSSESCDCRTKVRQLLCQKPKLKELDPSFYSGSSSVFSRSHEQLPLGGFLAMTRYLLLSSFFFLASCSTPTGNKNADVSQPHNFEKVLVKGDDFLITTFQKITDQSAPFVFYIEGDGLAFNGKYRVSPNPTPRKRMLINLAAMDKRPNVVYVARPCQYTPMELNPKCNSSYWTDKRLSEDVVNALNEVINKTNVNHQKFSLIGYSGGGGIAVLIAARNPKVKDVITIAGNLDHVAFNSYHNVTPMTASLNPIDYAKSVNKIPQLHLSGEKDPIVPPFIAEKYVKESASSCAQQKIFPGVTHKDGWNKVWESVYTSPVRCAP